MLNISNPLKALTSRPEITKEAYRKRQKKKRKCKKNQCSKEHLNSCAPESAELSLLGQELYRGKKEVVTKKNKQQIKEKS